MSSSKPVFVSVCNNGFAKGLEVFIKSIKKHNTFEFTYVVIYNDLISPLSLSNIELLKKSHSDIVFKNIPDNNYIKYVSRLVDRVVPSYLSIEAFNLIEYDRVVLWDCDLLCLGNLDYILSCECDIGVTNLFDDKKDYAVNARQSRQEFSAGLMVISKKYINRDTYKSLSEIVIKNTSYRAPFGDQPVLNDYFKNKEITFLDRSYNTYKRFFSDNKNLFRMESNLQKRFDSFSPKILHYAGKKPWQQDDFDGDDSYKFVNDMWREYVK